MFVVAETVFWSIAAAYVGFGVFDLTTFRIDGWLDQLCFYGFLGLTPLIIGTAIFRSQVSAGTADDVLRGVPLRPHQVLTPKAAAVGLAYLQLIGPCVIVYLIAEATFSRALPPMAGDNWLHWGVRKLFLYWEEAGHIAMHPPIAFRWEEAIIRALSVFQAVGWAALPLGWGLWMGVKLQRCGTPFLLAYVAYLVMPLVLFVVIHHNAFNVDLTDPFLFWPVVCTTGLSGMILSTAFFVLGCRAWGNSS